MKINKRKVKKAFRLTGKAIVSSHGFFNNMANGIDETLGIPQRRRDYMVIDRRRKKRRYKR